MTPPVEPAVSAYAPLEQDPARIEQSMLTLARAAARAGGRITAAYRTPPKTPPNSHIEGLLIDPVPYAMMQAELDLFLHLGKLVGDEAARAANRRVNAILFEEFARPAIDAAGPRQ